MMVMSKVIIKKMVTIIFIILALSFVVLILRSYIIYEFCLDGFASKEEIVALVKENFVDLKILTKEIYGLYDNKRFYAVIDNKVFRSKNSHTYKSNLSETIFKKLKIDYVVVYYDYPNRKHCVNYVVKNKFCYYCGFYYSHDDNKNYYNYDKIDIDKLKNNGTYFEFGNKTASIGSVRNGWYTEKICDNWYFFEEDFDYLNFIKYIYDDINSMNPISKYYQDRKEYFEKYNPHTKATLSELNTMH